MPTFTLIGWSSTMPWLFRFVAFVVPLEKSLSAFPLSKSLIVPVGQGNGGFVEGIVILQLFPLEPVTAICKKYPLLEPYAKFWALVVTDGAPVDEKPTNATVNVLA